MQRQTFRVRPLVAAVALLAFTACGSTVPAGSTRYVADGNRVTTNGDEVAEGTVDAEGNLVAADGSIIASGSGTSGGTTRGGTTGGKSATPAATSGPIPIGIVLTDPGTTDYQGISTGTTLTEQQVNDALIKAMNAAGGVAGRQLAPVYAPTNTASTNWSTDFAAACATFTQDNKVQAVLGYVFNYDQSFETCLTKNKIPHLSNGFNIPDTQELAKHPLHRSLAVPKIDDRSMLKLKNAIADGVLTKKNKIAVIVDGCPGSENSWKSVSKPFLDRNGIEYTHFPGDCSTGNNSGQANAVASVPNSLLKLRQEGVDTITFLTVSEGPILLILAAAAEAQGYRPKYIVSSLANLSALEGQAPAEQMRNVRGYGWMPGQDMAVARQPAKVAGQVRCLELLKTQGVVPREFGDLNNAYRICDAVFAYEAAVKATKGNTTGANVIAALDGLGTSFSNPDVLDGATIFGPGHENSAPAHARAIAWVDSCSCFQYTGPTRSIP